MARDIFHKKRSFALVGATENGRMAIKMAAIEPQLLPGQSKNGLTATLIASQRPLDGRQLASQER